LPEANVAVVSVPGPYAAIAAHSALSAGLHVLLFSDNVPLAEEVELKERASRLGLLLMGPGAGTAVLAGVGLGFANAVAAGPVGVVAAAGTGAQEVMSLLDRWGIGVSQVIGVGGRDLSAGVGGLMARDAVRALDADFDTEVILVVSKPPDPEVAQTVICASQATPVVAACLGMSAPDGMIAGAPLAATLEEGALRVATILGRPVPDLAEGLDGVVEDAAARVGAARTAVRGFFTGGTLCYEAQVVLGRILGPVYSNIPLHADLGLPAPAGAHICLDLGEEEYTKGRPHPMIDPAARIQIMQAEAFGDDIAAVLLDVVLGYGSHPDPAGEIAGTCADIVASGAAVVAYVLGARADRQGLDRQRQTLRDAGAIVTASAAEAARVAAAVAARQPALATAGR
jgi:FdrA protein